MHKVCKICKYEFYMQNMQQYALRTLLMSERPSQTLRAALSHGQTCSWPLHHQLPGADDRIVTSLSRSLADGTDWLGTQAHGRGESAGGTRGDSEPEWLRR